MIEKFVWINFRSTTEDRDMFRKDAHRHEMTMTEYFEWLVEKERKACKNEKNN